MEKEISTDVNANLQPTHYFIFKDKQYPFNMKLFKCYSQYFKFNKHLFKNTQFINLADETTDILNLSDSSINDFVDFCQSKKIKLSKANTSFLYNLAQKFIVPSLIEVTKEFIQSHRDEFVIEYFIMNTNQTSFNSEEYEDIISDNMSEYMKDDRLLSLPIPALHRITTKYTQKHKFDSKQPPDFIEFLFKCLDRIGIKASVLFDNVDFGLTGGEVMHRLFENYSEKFDFHFINANHLKSVYQLQSDIIKREEKVAKQLEDSEKEMKKMKNEQKRLFNQIQQQETINREINEKLQKQETINREISGKLQKQETINREINEKLQKQQNEIEQLKKSNDKKLQDLTDEFTRQLKLLKDQMKQKEKKIEEPKRTPAAISKRFSSESNPEGIVSILKDAVTLTAGGNPQPGRTVINIMKNDNSSFYNYYNYNPNSERHSYIEFDFGPSKKIDLCSYFIRSNGNPPSTYYHPKTWRIEGSNDNVNWTQLDRRANDQNLNGSYKQHHFECKGISHGKNENKFRYIRYVQEDSWCQNHPYYVFIFYFELYGDVFNC